MSSGHIHGGLLVLFLAACGASPAAHSSAPSSFEVRRVPFQSTLPSGAMIVLSDDGAVTVSGALLGTLETDGRFVGPGGETIAALAPDGTLSIGGEPIAATLQEGHLVENGVAVLDMDQDRTVTFRGSDGRDIATVPVVGVTPESRDTVLFVIAVHLLTRARDSALAARAVLEEDRETVRARVPVDGRPALGPDSALVTIVMFDDFECPFCVRAARTMEAIRDAYGALVRFVFVHRPLAFHSHADDAATAAAEAFSQRGNQGFWAMYELLFRDHAGLEREDLLGYAAQSGLDVERMRAALEGDLHRSELDEDGALADRLGATGTPSFFVNGVPIRGAQPFEVFRARIDLEIALGQRLVQAGVAPERIYAQLMEGAVERPPEPAPAPRRSLDPLAVYRVPIDGAPVRGAADALVTIVVFSDFQCPFCSRVVPTLDAVRAQYGADVRFVFRHNPLPFHERALPAAEAASEAYAQRGDAAFWQMHDTLFAHQDTLEREDLERFARAQHLDMARFRRALDGHVHAAAIAQDQALATSLGASGTPSFFINGRSLRGAQPLDAFTRMIDVELASARARVAGGTPPGSLYDAIILGGATSPVYLAAPPADDDQDDTARVYTIPVPPGAPSRGAAHAPVTIQIFSDFQCPFCARALPTVEAVLAQYAGRVRVVWRNYPLPFHDHAGPAAEAALEVFAQRGADTFWRFHDVLFANQAALTREDLERYASAVPGLDLARFRAALDDHRHQASIDADIEAVSRAGAQIGTPSFFVDGHLLQGAQPLDAFRSLIDEALAEHARP